MYIHWCCWGGCNVFPVSLVAVPGIHLTCVLYIVCLEKVEESFHEVTLYLHAWYIYMYSIEYEANILCECWFKQVHRSSRVPDLSFRNSDILLSVLLTFSYMYPRLIWTYWSFFSHLHCAWCFSPLSSSHSQVAVLVWYMLMIRFHYCIFVKKKKK